MSDIFISYKREEQATARKLANALESEGWTVWWDPKLRAGEHFDDVIEKALNEAKCVVVLWSERSVQSAYVIEEATYALGRYNLIPVLIEDVKLPFRFNQIQTANLSGWDGSTHSSEFRKLVEDISAIAGLPVAEEDNRKRIFISYRREDSAGYAQAILGRLVQYSEYQVTMDVGGDMEPGVQFQRLIEDAVGQCDILLAVIGKRWATRLDNPDDFVRLEISAALARNIGVTPVLVDGMTMPNEDDLPSIVQPITRRNAFEIRNSRFNYDLDHLITGLRRILKAPEGKRKVTENYGRGFEEERNRTQKEGGQRRLKAEAQHKAETERLSEQEQRSGEEVRQKAAEEKARNRAQPRPQIGTYDVFISFKNLDEKGVPTHDAELANEVYNFLTGKGLSVFISTVTLENLGVSNYKKAIDEALDAASIMVAVGTSTENLNSEWVRYEWDGFYNDILSGVKPGGKLFTYVAGLRPAQLPRTLRQTQTFIHSSSSLGQLHNFIIQALR